MGSSGFLQSGDQGGDGEWHRGSRQETEDPYDMGQIDPEETT